MPEHEQIFHALARYRFRDKKGNYNQKVANLPERLEKVEEKNKSKLLIKLIKKNLAKYTVQSLPESYINLQ